MKNNVRARIAQINGIGGRGEWVLSEAFTKQHYIAIAKILKDARDVDEVVNRLVDFFANDNPNFAAHAFLSACGRPAK